MISTKLVPCFLVTAALCAPRAARADGEPTPAAEPTPPPPVQVAPLAQPAQPAPDPVQEQRMDRAQWSGKRLALEILAGEAAGLLTSYALCNDSGCPGDGWLAFGADLAVSPLAVYGVGRLMGGQGTLLSTYLGASPALSPFLFNTGSVNETAADAISRAQTNAMISAALLPLTSALFYEISSQIASTRWRREHQPAVSLRPLYQHQGISGGVGAVAIAF